MPFEYSYTAQGGPSTPSSDIPGTPTAMINDPQQSVHGCQSHPEEITSEEDCVALSLG